MQFFVDGEEKQRFNISEDIVKDASKRLGLVGGKWKENNEVRCVVAKDGEIFSNEYYYVGENRTEGDMDAEKQVEKNFFERAEIKRV